ncbi:MAG: hypothetical protein JXR76_16995 [Deltaproteobacteria bacterium]|nr:hypothetical protein [Deltaproteobacteria bacterium]
MKQIFGIFALLLCFFPHIGHAKAPAQVRVLFIVQKLPRFTGYQQALLAELQMLGTYNWIVEELAFNDASLPGRFAQVKPLGESMKCDTAVWIDEVSNSQALVQLLAMAPGRMSLRSIEANMTDGKAPSQVAADTAIVVNELLAQTDAELKMPMQDEIQDAKASAPTAPADAPAHKQKKDKPPKRDYFLFATGETDVVSYNPFAILPGGGLEGCTQSAGGWGGCLMLGASGRRDWRVSDVDVSQLQVRPGLAVVFSRRLSLVSFGARLSVRPVLQYVKVEPNGFATESAFYMNGNASLAWQGRVFVGNHWVGQMQLGAMLWFRKLTFSRQSAATSLFDTPRLSPMLAVSMGAVF